jgi:hypothetical protein
MDRDAHYVYDVFTNIFEYAFQDDCMDNVTPCFPQSIKITILAKNYGKFKDVNV